MPAVPVSQKMIERKTTTAPSRLDAIVAAIINVFSARMSTGQLRQMKPGIQAAVIKAVDDLETAGNEPWNVLHTLRPRAEWHEDIGPVLWWDLPIQEPPYCGTPLDSDWPCEYSHWSPLPDPRVFTASDGANIQ